MASNNIGKDASTYDIIIVGGGTAGCVLANRLSEDPDCTVLLVEAGQDSQNDPNIYTPGHLDKLLHNPDYDWQYVSEPQDGLYGRSMPHPRGKVLGGSSAINSFALIYPSATSVNAWVELGNKGWGWQDFAKYYRKFQTISPPSPKVRDYLDISYLDKSSEDFIGPIRASFPGVATEMHRAWIDTFAALGFPVTTDPLKGEAMGGHISTCHITGNTRERSHAGTAYIDPIRSRPNFHLLTGALVEKIVFNTTVAGPARATGISYTRAGQSHTLLATKEVILAAGTFGSPQLLELSGIGSPSLLYQHGIEAVYDNPNVGENLQDHIRSGLSFEASDKLGPRKPAIEADQTQYDENRTGPLAEKTACHTFAYMPLTTEARASLEASLDWYLNDPKSKQSPFEKIHGAFIRRMIESPIEATSTAFMSRKTASLIQDPGHWLSFFGMLSHPFSRGHVHIKSASPCEKPIIDFKYYSHPLDAELHAHHVQFFEQIAATEPLASFLKPGGKRLPAGYSIETIEEAKVLVRSVNQTNYHPCGTCAMMREDLGGVVDERLRVYGTSNLRVADASVFPIIPRGNIIATVYAAAEKAADLISQDLGIRRIT